MALTGMSKDEIQALAYVMYGEDSTNSDFTGTIVNTCVQEAVREFCMLTNALVGSARRERPSATGGYEAFITLPTGMYRVTRVHHMRYAKAGTAW